MKNIKLILRYGFENSVLRIQKYDRNTEIFNLKKNGFPLFLENTNRNFGPKNWNFEPKNRNFEPNVNIIINI